MRHNSRPFGGIQLVLAGDFLQLPPVEKGAKESTYVFETNAWKESMDLCIELKRVFRQKNQEFVGLLQAIRLGKVSDEHHAMLVARMGRKLNVENGIIPTRLYTHRNSVASENQKELEHLKGRAYVFAARDSGKDEYSKENLIKNCLAPTILKLRNGAQVMLLKNLDPPHLVNGSRGVIIGFERVSMQEMDPKDKRKTVRFEDREYPKVKFDNGMVRVMTPQEWELERAGEVLATRAQVPLCLAWALSIHKCQGMTIDKVEVDISSAWDPGQAYVALSRCTDLQGLGLLGYIRSKIHASQKVLEYYESLQSGIAREETNLLKKKLRITQ